MIFWASITNVSLSTVIGFFVIISLILIFHPPPKFFFLGKYNHETVHSATGIGKIEYFPHLNNFYRESQGRNSHSKTGGGADQICWQARILSILEPLRGRWIEEYRFCISVALLPLAKGSGGGI
jgi:hypothetical protein